VPGSARIFKSDANVGPFGFSDAEGYVAQVPEGHGQPFNGRCVVAFRGSVDLMNYYHDFNFVPSSWPDWPDNDNFWCPSCTVHVGVAQCYRDLREKMLFYIRELQCTSMSVTGHSLGAGIATLASMELRSAGHPVAPVYTFGKLRVGNKEFVRAYMTAATQQGVNPPMWRVVNGHDPVPRLPPTLNGMFAHEPVEVYYPTETLGIYKICSPFGQVLEDPACMLSVPIDHCIRNPQHDHTWYLNASTLTSNMPPACDAPAKPLWSV
jgi:hypothetical protein